MFLATDASKNIVSQNLTGAAPVTQVAVQTVGRTTFLSLPQDVATGSFPRFAGLTLFDTLGITPGPLTGGRIDASLIVLAPTPGTLTCELVNTKFVQVTSSGNLFLLNLTGSTGGTPLKLSSSANNVIAGPINLATDVTGILPSANGGAVTLTGIGSTPNANGASISNQVLQLQPASSAFGGVVTTTTQIFAGDKTFGGNVTVTGTTTIGASGTVNTVISPLTGITFNNTTTGYVPFTLNYVERYTATPTFLDGTGAITPTSGTFQFYISRVGSLVSFFLPYTFFSDAAGTRTGDIMSPVGTIPTRLMPPLNAGGVCRWLIPTFNGTARSSGLFQILNTGALNMKFDLFAGGTWGATNNEISGIGVSWTI
jgi:hypothetical protein